MKREHFTILLTICCSCCSKGNERKACIYKPTKQSNVEYCFAFCHFRRLFALRVLVCVFFNIFIFCLHFGIVLFVLVFLFLAIIFKCKCQENTQSPLKRTKITFFRPKIPTIPVHNVGISGRYKFIYRYNDRIYFTYEWKIS